MVTKSIAPCAAKNIKLKWSGISQIWGGGGTLRIFGWGCATVTLEPLAYTRASSSDFCYPILDLTPQIPPSP